LILFGHEGPVLGGAWLGYRLLRSGNSASPRFRRLAGLFQSGFDFRFVLIGAILPDLVDKPLGHLIFKEQLSNGRVYGHTFLFFLLLFICGLWLYQRRSRSWLLVLALGDLGHLILDEIWNVPVTLAWPLLGWGFPRLDMGLLELASHILEELLRNPQVFFVESVGFLICLAFSIDLLRRKKIWLFVRKGAIE